jgi:hypothetical protein
MSSQTVKGVLYLAYEFGWNQWKPAFATGIPWGAAIWLWHGSSED